MTYHLANLSDISNYIDSNNYNIDYSQKKPKKTTKKDIIPLVPIIYIM